MMVYSAKSDEWAKTGRGSLGGVEAAADMGGRALVLELKIPLERDAATGYGIGVRAGQTVGVGVESPEIKGADPGSRGGPGGPGGPAGSGDMGGSDGMGGPEGAGGGEPRRPEAIKVWGTLTLGRRAS